MYLMMMDHIGKITQDGDVMKSHVKTGEMVMNIPWLVKVIIVLIVRTQLEDHIISVIIGIAQNIMKILLNWTQNLEISHIVMLLNVLNTQLNHMKPVCHLDS